MKTFVSSSAEMQEFVNGDLVQNVGYSANYDGDLTHIHVTDGDKEYYTQLDNDDLLDLLDVPDTKEDLMERLGHDFPLTNDFSKTSKSRSRKKSNRSKDKSKKKK